MIAVIDYGRARCGMALGERLPSKVFTISPKDVVSELLKYQPEIIVVGLPLSMSGRYSTQTFEAVRFAEKLQKKLQAKVYMIDERLTSKMFEGRKNVDELVAVRLFQEFVSSKAILHDIKPIRTVSEEVVGAVRNFTGKILLAEVSDLRLASNNTVIFQTDPYYAYLFFKAGFNVERSLKELEKHSPFDIIIVVEEKCEEFKSFLSKNGKLVCL